jgi:hypothetical protein
MIVAFSVGQVRTLLRSSFHLTLFRLEHHSVVILHVSIVTRLFLRILIIHLGVGVASGDGSQGSRYTQRLQHFSHETTVA